MSLRVGVFPFLAEVLLLLRADCPAARTVRQAVSETGREGPQEASESMILGHLLQHPETRVVFIAASGHQG
jgi:hypothetical protein